MASSPPRVRTIPERVDASDYQWGMAEVSAPFSGSGPSSVCLLLSWSLGEFLSSGLPDGSSTGDEVRLPGFALSFLVLPMLGWLRGRLVGKRLTVSVLVLATPILVDVVFLVFSAHARVACEDRAPNRIRCHRQRAEWGSCALDLNRCESHPCTRAQVRAHTVLF